jgi:DNA-directed RNA polymerase subunit beta
VLSVEEAKSLDAAGVAEVTIDADGEPLKVISNKMCDLTHFVDFDPLEVCGIKERVRYEVLQELLGQYSGEELKEQIRAHKRRAGSQAHCGGRHPLLHQLH